MRPQLIAIEIHISDNTLSHIHSNVYDIHGVTATPDYPTDKTLRVHVDGDRKHVTRYVSDYDISRIPMDLPGLSGDTVIYYNYISTPTDTVDDMVQSLLIEYISRLYNDAVCSIDKVTQRMRSIATIKSQITDKEDNQGGEVKKHENEDNIHITNN